MNLNEYCPEKIMTAEKAVSKIKSGSRVFVGTGCGEPQHLIKAMRERYKFAGYHGVSDALFDLSQFIEDEPFLRRFSLKLFFISSSMRKAAFEGKIDYIPTYLSQIPELLQPPHWSVISRWCR